MDPIQEQESDPHQGRRVSGRILPARGKDYLLLVDRGMDPHLLVYHDPRSDIAEQYRTFRTNLVALNPEGSPRALAITSSIKGEGKSITAANLAIALVELPDTRTLLIDADLRDPKVAEMFGVKNDVGLSDLLLDGLPLERVVQPTLVPNLFLLPSGREVRNCSELLGSPRISDLVHALKADYQYILFDTPPVLPFADATVLGTRMDGTLVVVRMEKTPKDQIERSLDMLRSARNRVIGCFLAGSRSLEGQKSDYVIQDD